MKNKFILILFISLIVRCKKKQTFEHSEINFSYADNIAGNYIGTKTIYAGNPYIAYDSTFTIQVTDKRTKKECKFFVDLFNEEIILMKDGSFVTTWTSGANLGGGSLHVSCGFIRDSLFIEEIYSSQRPSFTTYKFIGARQ